MTKILGKALLLIVTMLVALASAEQAGVRGHKNKKSDIAANTGRIPNVTPAVNIAIAAPGGTGGNIAPTECPCKCLITSELEGVLVMIGAEDVPGSEACVGSAFARNLAMFGMAKCATCDETP